MRPAKTLKRFIYLPFTFVLITLMGFQCRDVEEPEYDFDIGIYLTPEQVEYKVGDTIKLKYHIYANSLFDTKTGKNIQLGRTRIPFKIYFGKRVADQQLLNLPNRFVIKVNNVSDSLIILKENGQYSEIKYNLGCEMIQNDLEIEIFCVLKKTGIFKLEVWGDNYIYFNGFGDCSEYVYDQQFGNLSYRFRVNNSNIKLLGESPLPPNVFISGDPAERKTREKRIFWFKVKD